MGLFWGDVFNYIIRVQYGIAQREDITVTFSEPTSFSALHELKSLAGVLHAEPFRFVPVRLRNEYRKYDLGIEGIPQWPYLRRVIDDKLRPIQNPDEGVILTENLAEFLDVRPGDKLRVEVREGRRYERDVAVVGIRTIFGVGRLYEPDSGQSSWW